MDNYHLQHELRILAQAIATTEELPSRLKLLEDEINSIKLILQAQCRISRNVIFSILGGITASQIFKDFADNAPTYSAQPEIRLLDHNHIHGNEFGNQKPTSILEEIKAMIVELNIKASVRERANGLIELRSQALGSIYGRTKEEIERKLNQKLKEARTKKKTAKDRKKVPLLSEFFTSQYLPYKKQTLATRSIADIELDENFIIGKGKFNKTLDQYTTQNIETFLYTIPQTRKRQKVRGLINNILTYAKRMGLIKTNPCDDVEKIRHEQKIGEALSFQEQMQFFDNLYGDDSIELNHKLYFTFVYLTGTRRGEALGITDDDVDFENNTLHIPGTKTKGSNRVIPMFPIVKTLLQSIKPENGIYFPIKADRVDSIMRRVKGNAHHPHELRHTFGTIKICVERLDPKTVSLYLGHTTTAMTLTRYTHPEQLNKGLFYNGSLTEEDKLLQLREQYEEVLRKITDFLTERTQ